jgi:RHS repeat-associated protein
VWDTAQVTHYTGIGTEVRENYAGLTKETKVVVNMPQGLGRYGIEDAERPNYDGVSGDSLAGYIPNAKFEWCLKNHLGSTMLVYGTQADANPQHVFVGTPLAAYDYRAFGEMVEMLPPAQKVTENFTGKEHDDEIALDYFGARYLDPMLGMWISVDPARQFASPYQYSGNGYNPVNVVDPDGNAAYMSVDENNVIKNMMYDVDDNNTVEVQWDNGDFSTFNGPDYDSYFYSLGDDGVPNIVGQKIDNNMELKAKTMLNDVNPLTIWRWNSNGEYDFKNRYYGSDDATNTVGVLNGTIMTARDVGNAIWAGYTRYTYLCKLGCSSSASIQNAHGLMIDISNFVAGGKEDRSSASMQSWGFYNYKP